MNEIRAEVSHIWAEEVLEVVWEYVWWVLFVHLGHLDEWEVEQKLLAVAAVLRVVQSVAAVSAGRMVHTHAHFAGVLDLVFYLNYLNYSHWGVHWGV